MLKRKSQAALEYITTYAMAFAILVIMLGAISYYSLLDFEKYLPEKCAFSSQFRCVDYSLGSGAIKVKLLNNIKANIKISEISVENNEEPELKCTGTLVDVAGLKQPFLPDMDWSEDTILDIEFNGCSGGGYSPKQRLESIVILKYYSPDTGTEPPVIHETRGKIVAMVRS